MFFDVISILFVFNLFYFYYFFIYALLYVNKC